MVEVQEHQTMADSQVVNTQPAANAEMAQQEEANKAMRSSDF